MDIFLIDDEFPKIPEFADASIYDSGINSENLYHLAVTQTWKGLQYLQQLIKDLITSKPYQANKIRITGYTKPTQCLFDIEAGLKPEVVIYDWEYGMPNPTESQQWLLDILNSTEAFVFVYSKVRDELPPFLNKKVFDTYSKRFQLFKKGSTDHSIFSSEEFIFQYILGKIVKSGKIKIQGFDIEFTANSYLKNASDILYLERIFGRIELLEQLKKNHFNINDTTIEKILSEAAGYLFFNESKGILICPDESSLIEKFQPLKEISFVDVAKHYSIFKLEETLEKGIALI